MSEAEKELIQTQVPGVEVAIWISQMRVRDGPDKERYC